ncbi:MAG: hypothetical protein ACRDUA_21320, partial [Micromonosporaceae bacterium]
PYTQRDKEALMAQHTPSFQRLAEIDARAAESADPVLQADVVCLVRLISSLLAMHSPTPDGRRCGECEPLRAALLRRRHRPPTPCRTRWLLDVVIGRS